MWIRRCAPHPTPGRKGTMPNYADPQGKYADTPIHKGNTPTRRYAALAVRGVTVHRCIGAQLFWGRCLRLSETTCLELTRL